MLPFAQGGAGAPRFPSRPYPSTPNRTTGSARTRETKTKRIRRLVHERDTEFGTAVNPFLRWSAIRYQIIDMSQIYKMDE